MGTPSRKTLVISYILNVLEVNVRSEEGELELALYKMSERELRLLKYYIDTRLKAANPTEHFNISKT